MRVFKFGGASVKDAAGIKNVYSVLQTAGYEDVLLVVSAMGKTTNALELVIKNYFEKSAELQSSVQEVKKYHNEILLDLFEDENNPAFEFITSCPTDWAQTVVPDAKIGEYVTIARKDKQSESWFVGSITNGDARQLSLPLSFLAKDKKYKAKIFKDGNGADYKSNPYPVDIVEQEVDINTVLTLNLAPSGGTAIILTQID